MDGNGPNAGGSFFVGGLNDAFPFLVDYILFQQLPCESTLFVDAESWHARSRSWVPSYSGFVGDGIRRVPSSEVGHS